MPNIHNLSSTKGDEQLFFDAIELAFKAIKAGEIIIAPAENGYLYLVDAFNYKAVKKLHDLTGSAYTDLFQVLLPRISTLSGICLHNLGDLQSLDSSSESFGLNEFLKRVWPGAFSLTIKTQPGLTWNLGVKSDLANVRVPNSKFLLKLLDRTGPLAVTNTKLSYAEILKNSFSESIGYVFDFGDLPTYSSSIIEMVDLKNIRLIREGAISYAQIKAWSSELAISIVP